MERPANTNDVIDSRDITEIIDDDCREQLGHSNWVIISTLSDQE